MAAKNDDLSTVEGALKFGVDPNTKELDEVSYCLVGRSVRYCILLFSIGGLLCCGHVRMAIVK